MFNHKYTYSTAALPEPKNDWALFLDVDGTLAEIVPTPDQAVIPAPVLENLTVLQQSLNGAVALISGRSIASLDTLCNPHRFPAAGQHGLERRLDNDRIVVPGNHHIIHELSGSLAVFERAHPGLLVEYKGLSIAVHYRNAPELAAEVKTFLMWHANRHPQDLILIEGKMVCEIRLRGAHKGTAIMELMKQPPFAGRTPVFVGDDRTDEDGFAAVNHLGGITVKIGQGITAAAYRLADVSEVWLWLEVCTELLKEESFQNMDNRKSTS